MCEDEYQYVLELSKRQSGAVLGRGPIHPDWAPLQEALALDLVRRSARANFDEPPDIRIEPQWSDPAAGSFICGLRATAISGDEGSDSLQVSIDYFRVQAQRAADRFVKSGDLQPGELFEYRVLALAKQPTPPPSSPRFAMKRVATPVPIAPALLADYTGRALSFITGADDDVPVFVPWQVAQGASVLTRQAGALECGGVLVGHVRRDPAVAEVFLEITAQIPAHAHSEVMRLSFSPDTWSDVQAEVNSRGQNEVWLGWWHSHSFSKQEAPSEGKDSALRRRPALPFLSEEDLLLHRTVFPRAYSLALLITDSPQNGMSWTMFGWRSGTIARRDFHVIDAPLPKAFTALRGNDHATIR